MWFEVTVMSGNKRMVNFDTLSEIISDQSGEGTWLHFTVGSSLYVWNSYEDIKHKLEENL
jgi:hypothetical protein